MIDLFLRILAFIVAISVLVAVHEFGHYWVARRLGFKVLRYSIGFGRPLAKWTGRDGVEYWLSAIPLGGYVKMLDEREGPVDESERHRAFQQRPIPHRIAVLLAGPGFNFLFAIAAYWLLFVTGVPGIKPVIGHVEAGSVAAQAGLRPGDEIEAVGGERTQTWEAAIFAILDEMLDDGQIDLSLTAADGDRKTAVLDVRGRLSELTEPDALFAGLGIRTGPELPAVVERVEPDSPAAAAGLEPGDRALALDGIEISGWAHFTELIRERPGETLPLTVLRDAQRIRLDVSLAAVEDAGERRGQLGVYPRTQFPPEVIEEYSAVQRYGPLAAVPQGLAKTSEMTVLTMRMLGRMVTGDVSLRNVSGPISIATYAGDSAKAGFSAFLSFLAIVSISLGIMNLLPVPILDGGQIVYQVAEGIKGAPLSERAMIVGQQIGMVLLIVLMTFVFYNDLTRVFE